MSGSTYTWVGGADINGANNWTTPANWDIGGVAATAFPNSATDVAIINSDVGASDAIISAGQSIMVASLSIGDTTGEPGGHLIVGGSSAIGGGGSGTLTSVGAITITSTNSGGALVGGRGDVITAPSMTLSGTSVVVGGGGIFNISTIVNNGMIQADGGNFNLGMVVLNSTTISGTGVIEVDGPSGVEINAATAEGVQVAVNSGQKARVIFDQPSAFTGGLDVLTANSGAVDLFFKGQTPTGVAFNADTHTLDITGASGTLDSIPFVANGSVALNVIPSTMQGYGEVVLGHPTGTPFDFSGDGRSDVLLQNTDSTIVIETQSALAITGASVVAQPGAGWHVVSSADFNGDGQADILIQNTNGQIVDYLMSGTAVAASNYLGNPGVAWHVRGTGDFNANGKADVVLQNDDSSIMIWKTNGSAVAAVSVGNPGAGWTVEGAADFNGDGQSDILLQNTNGQLVVDTMNGTTIAASSYLGNPGAGWAVAGTGDYNSDGKADILLHNDNGADVIWETNGTAVTGQVYVGNPGVNYTGSAAGIDLDGNGSSDLMIQGTGSKLVGYTFNNNATITAGAVLGKPGSGWLAVGNDPMQFIDGTGSNLNLTATPGADQFDLTSYITGSHQISGFDTAQDSVALSKSLFTSYSSVQSAETPYQGGTYIQLNSGSALVIQGVTPTELGSSNFVLR